MTADANNCSFPGLYTISAKPNCSDILDVKSLMDNFTNKAGSVECPHECDSTYYNLAVNNVYDKYNEGTNMFKIYVYYKQLRYRNITQVPKTAVTDLVSAIGGTLGLFVGLRLLSFVEIIEFILETSFLAGKNLCKNKL